MTPGPATGADLVAQPLSPSCEGLRSFLKTPTAGVRDHSGGLPLTPGDFAPHGSMPPDAAANSGPVVVLQGVLAPARRFDLCAVARPG